MERVKQSDGVWQHIGRLKAAHLRAQSSSSSHELSRFVTRCRWVQLGFEPTPPVGVPGPSASQ